MGVKSMNKWINKKAVSTLIMIILILCSVIFGALVSYLWVMASFYNMPQNTTLLVVHDAVFSANNVTHFNVTILNPSNSVSNANITAIRVRVDGTAEVYDINETEPALPFVIQIGTEQTFKCKRNWSDLSGETVTIEPVPVNASTQNYSYATEKVATPKLELKLTPNFNISQTVENFSITIENSAESVINLTISEISVFENIINTTTPTLPYVLSPNYGQTFQCKRNWQSLMGVNASITVKTEEGFESNYTTATILGAFLYIGEVKFDYTDMSYFNLTVVSSPESTAEASLNRVNLTLTGQPPITLNTTYPTNINVIPITILKNQSQVFKCLWDWNTHRNETVTIDIFTRQGITSPPQTVRTPPSIVWDITDINFDLDYTDHFLVNVTNTPCSLNEITITKIVLNDNVTTMNPPSATLTNGTQETFNCTFDWSTLRGQTVIVAVIAQDGSNISRIVTLPSVQLKLQDANPIFDYLHNIETNTTTPYFNITIFNSINSLQNRTLTQITIETANATYTIDGTLTYPKLAPNGYVLTIGANSTFICLWDWTLYLTPTIKITVYTAEGLQVSQTYVITPP
jgi:hypothetical protein